MYFMVATMTKKQKSEYSKTDELRKMPEQTLVGKKFNLPQPSGTAAKTHGYTQYKQGYSRIPGCCSGGQGINRDRHSPLGVRGAPGNTNV